IVLMYIIISLNPVDYVEGAVQITPLIQKSMFSLVTLLPAAGMLLSVIPIFFYDLIGEKKEKVTRELFERRHHANGEIE
ncbi:MAG: hypothetical protein PHC84_06555, partial [Clostridia bacterium]|nr:hypothetical protein [Clostridia bacterium]